MKTIGLKTPPKPAPKQKKKGDEKQKDDVQSPDTSVTEGQNEKADDAE